MTDTKQKKDLLNQAIQFIDEWIKYQMLFNDYPGASVGIFFEDEIIFKKEYGYANRDEKVELNGHHMFRVASNTKLFTATAIMILKKEGKLSLHDKILKYLPWFTSQNDSNLKNIEIIHLLTHTSGIVCDGNTGHWTNLNFPELSDLMTQVKTGISIFKIGEEVKYSNFGYAILGQVIEIVTGKKYEEVIQEKILKPLNMTNSQFYVPNFPSTKLAHGYNQPLPKQERKFIDQFPVKTMNPAIGLYSTVEDLIKFFKAHLYGNDILISDILKREMHQEHYNINNNGRGLGFGISQIADDSKLLYHSGGINGFRSHTGIIPDAKLIIVSMINAYDVDNYWLWPLARFVKNIIDNPENFIQNGKEFSQFEHLKGYYHTNVGVVYFNQLGNQLVSIVPESKWFASTLQIYEHYSGDIFKCSKEMLFAKIGEKIRFEEDEIGNKRLIDCGGAIAPQITLF